MSRFVKYGPLFRADLLGYPMYVVGDAAATREVLRGSVAEFLVPGRAFHLIIGDLDHMSGDHHAAWARRPPGARSPRTWASRRCQPPARWAPARLPSHRFAPSPALSCCFIPLRPRSALLPCRSPNPQRKTMNQALGPASLDVMLPQLLPVVQGSLADWAARGSLPLFDAVRGGR